MRIDRIVTNVLVQDMDRALPFYRDILGLTLEFEEEDWAIFSEGVSLSLAPEPMPPDLFRVNAVSLALYVPNAQAAFNELTGKGIPFLIAPTEVPGAIVATLRDPDSNLLQLLQPR